MRTYTRAQVPGGCYFFTLNLAERKGNDLLVQHIAELREAFRTVHAAHPFAIEGIVILPDHLHCIWRLPDDDADFSMRWRPIKAGFSALLPHGERISASRARKGERGVWQRRYWEHVIRDERDFRNHMDYLHYNPVKHDYVNAVCDWPHSSFHRLVDRGIYDIRWGAPEAVADLYPD